LPGDEGFTLLSLNKGVAPFNRGITVFFPCACGTKFKSLAALLYFEMKQVLYSSVYSISEAPNMEGETKLNGGRRQLMWCCLFAVAAFVMRF